MVAAVETTGSGEVVVSEDASTGGEVTVATSLDASSSESSDENDWRLLLVLFC